MFARTPVLSIYPRALSLGLTGQEQDRIRVLGVLCTVGKTKASLYGKYSSCSCGTICLKSFISSLLDISLPGCPPSFSCFSYYWAVFSHCVAVRDFLHVTWLVVFLHACVLGKRSCNVIFLTIFIVVLLPPRTPQSKRQALFSLLLWCGVVGVL